MLWFLLVLACGEGNGDATGEGEASGKPKVDPRSLIDVTPVVAGSVSSSLSASGIIEAESQATLLPEAQGRVSALYVEEGDTVTRGQLLAVIASPTLDAAYQRASAELERARAEAVTATRLFEQGALSRTELEMAQRAQSAARTAHEEATRTRGFTRIVSPISGTVAQRGLRFGELAGGVPAFVIVDLDQLKVVLNLPERELSRIHEGQPVRLRSAWDEKQQTTGRVARIAPVVDATTGTFRVTVTLDPGQRSLRPGQYASVDIEVDRHEGVLTIPRRGLVWEEGKPSVFTLAEGPPPEEPGKGEGKEGEGKEGEGKEGEGKEGEEGKEGGSKEGGGWMSWLGLGGAEEKEEEELPGPWRRVVRTAVKVGYEDGDKAEILDGLAEGTQVVVVGNEALRDQARVRLPGDPTVTDEEGKEGKEDKDGKDAEGAGATP